ncbi:MAG: MJ1477/TM1410 family putative glycoside hydrolase, partial [Candidatus Odinarchaeota archaeon]
RVEFNLNGEIIDDFAYLLQNINTDTIRESKYDLIIMDYSSDGNETGEFTSSELNYMKSIDEKKKFLISYISIGEAENYRFYWNESWDANHDGIPDTGAPSWLDIENPDWEGNYKVKFWMIEWQQIIFNYLDKIIHAGFDGIYMDIIDAYEFYQETIPNISWKMIDFVGNISKYVKNQLGNNFSVFVQNADELLLNSTYLECIDGIGREDLFYFDNVPTSESWQNQGIMNLNIAIDNNKIVLVTDYPQVPSLKYEFYIKCIENGFLGYVADRELDSLKENDLYPPT